MKKNMMTDFIISRHIEGISLNPLEHVLNEDDTFMVFPSPEDAIEFLIDKGASKEEIGYRFFIGTETEHDMITYNEDNDTFIKGETK